MNRKNLTAAVLAGLAGAAGIVGSAQAVNVNPDGLGQVLLYPYYTTNANNVTVLSVVNTSEEAKAVKVRFLEGQNTREVLDFNLYMSAFDVWTAALYKNADGVPMLETADTSCTVPYIYGQGGTQEFLPYALNDTAIDIAERPVEELNSRMSEGHFEMIEMGTLMDLTEGSATAATHEAPTEAGVPAMPADCAQLVAAWTDPDDTVLGDEGYWLKDKLVDLSAPSGGLFGGAAIVNVAKASMASYDATAINGFATTVRAFDTLHQEPGNVLPSLNSGDVMNGIVFLDDGTIQDSGALARGVDAVSYVLMHDQIMNEYTTEASTLANTEWVVTFPTKHFYVYEGSAGLNYPVPVAPFTSVWDSTEDDPTACEVVILDTIWDREEQTFVPTTEPGEEVPPIVSPPPPDVPPTLTPKVPFELCYETSVIRFGDPDDAGAQSPLLGSHNFHNVNTAVLGFEKGWARIQLDEFSYDSSGNGVVDCDSDTFTGSECYSRADLGNLNGLPVLGFAVETFVNGFLGTEAPYTIGNYGGLYKHKGTRKIGSDAGTFPPVVAPTAQ